MTTRPASPAIADPVPAPFARRTGSCRLRALRKLVHVQVTPDETGVDGLDEAGRIRRWSLADGRLTTSFQVEGVRYLSSGTCCGFRDPRDAGRMLVDFEGSLRVVDLGGQRVEGTVTAAGGYWKVLAIDPKGAFYFSEQLLGPLESRSLQNGSLRPFPAVPKGTRVKPLPVERGQHLALVASHDGRSALHSDGQLEGGAAPVEMPEELENVFLLDGGALWLTVSRYEPFTLWRARDSLPLWRFKRHAVAWATVAATDSRGRYLAAGFSDGAVGLFDRESGKVLGRWTDATESITFLRFLDRSTRLLALDDGGVVHVLSVPELKPALSLPRLTPFPAVVWFLPGDELIGTAGAISRQSLPSPRAKLSVWDARSGDLVRTTSGSKDLGVLWVARDGSHVLTPGRLWDVVSGGPVREFPGELRGNPAALDSKLTRLVAVRQDFVSHRLTLQAADLATGRVLWKRDLPGERASPLLVDDFHGRVLVGTSRGEMLALSLASGEPMASASLPPDLSAAFRYFPATVLGPDGKELVCTAPGGRLFAWDARTLALKWQNTGAVSDLAPLAISSRGRLAGGLYWPGRDVAQTLVILDAATGERQSQADVPGGIASLAFSSDGAHLLVGTYAGEVLWLDVPS